MFRFGAKSARMLCRRAYSDGPLKKTALHDFHQEIGGKMVPFCGWSMPVQYKDGVKESHLWVRSNAGLFDVSHMQQLRLTGKDRVKFIETLCPGDIAGLPAGNGTLSVYTNENGGIIDDTIITRQEDHLYVVCNAGCADKDIAHYRKMMEAANMDVQLDVVTSHALLALQGPAAAKTLQALVPGDLSKVNFMEGRDMVVDGIPCYVTRCGYTGEDGFEISVPNEKAVDLAKTLLANPDVKAAGLAPRDSLRLEAGLCLYGNDIDDTTTPVEAGLAWVIGKRRRTEGGFIGAEKVLAQLGKGNCPRKRIGLIVEGPPARSHYKVFTEDGSKELGEITSGSPSPSTGKQIAMAYVPTALSKAGTPLQVEVRKKMYPATVAKMPFTPSNYYRAP